MDTTTFTDIVKSCFKKKKVTLLDDEMVSKLQEICPVQRPWLYYLPWKMQTVVNQGLRAPDSAFAPKIKIICRWMRSVCLSNADENHTFMCRKESLPSYEDINHELNYLTLHFVTHFLYALEIIGYKHPDEEIKQTAFNLYKNVVELHMHFMVESEQRLNTRLADVSKKKMPDVFREAPRPKICPTKDIYID